MLRMAVLIVFFATLVGALMPSGTKLPEKKKPATIRVDAFKEAGPPVEAAEPGSGTISLQRSFDGHFYADAQVNGTTVHFLIDTGASGIALSSDDARRAGLMFQSG